MGTTRRGCTEAIINMESEDKKALFRILDAYIRDTNAKKAYS